MTQEYGQISAKLRTGVGKGTARKLRMAGRIPAVMYGKGEDNVMISLDPRDVLRAMDPERKFNTFFKVTFEDGSVEQCMLTDSQIHPTRDEFIHVDFLRVNPETEVRASIPVEYTGRPAGVTAGGRLRTYQRSMRIAAKPADIPVSLIVDTTELDGGESLRLKTLTLENCRLLDHPETVMAHVDMPRSNEGEGEGGAEASEEKS